MRDPLGAVAVEIGDHDAARAFGGEPVRERAADAGRTAGDDHDLLGEFHRQAAASSTAARTRSVAASSASPADALAFAFARGLRFGAAATAASTAAAA